MQQDQNIGVSQNSETQQIKKKTYIKHRWEVDVVLEAHLVKVEVARMYVDATKPFVRLGKHLVVHRENSLLHEALVASVIACTARTMRRLFCGVNHTEASGVRDKCIDKLQSKAVELSLQLIKTENRLRLQVCVINA